MSDAQYARIDGIPYLRLDRFHESTRPSRTADQGTLTRWIDALRQLDRESRVHEIANLPVGSTDPEQLAQVDGCADTLRRHDWATGTLLDRVMRAGVPDAYRTGARIAGLYPLSSVPFLAGVRDLHERTRKTFAMPLPALPVQGLIRRYGPPAGADDALRRHAPHWEIDVATSDDIPGTVSLTATDRSRVDGDPAVYTYESRTRWHGRVLRQLNYVIWFPARPRTGPLDLLGGHLDGITWRVTLDVDGEPLIYDAMHNCGCYHQVFPTARVRQTQQRVGREEPILVPQRLNGGAGPLLIRLAAGTHYLQRVRPLDDADPAPSTDYRLVSYEVLRSLPLPEGGRRSLFGPDGLVPGTARRERWLFWPMGVPSAGAMRQRGHHAIAFVGRRHFDDARLLERYFEPITAEQQTAPDR